MYNGHDVSNARKGNVVVQVFSTSFGSAAAGPPSRPPPPPFLCSLFLSFGAPLVGACSTRPHPRTAASDNPLRQSAHRQARMGKTGKRKRRQAAPDVAPPAKRTCSADRGSGHGAAAAHGGCVCGGSRGEGAENKRKKGEEAGGRRRRRRRSCERQRSRRSRRSRRGRRTKEEGKRRELNYIVKG